MAEVDMRPSLSIIIPTFQSAKTLAETLESIRCQTFKDFEIIIMDGGSNDGTQSIANSLAPSFDQLLLHSERDNGVYDAMNKGILRSRGQWLFFLGSDDRLYSSQTLATMSEHWTKSIDVVYGNVSSPILGERYAGKFDFERLLNQNICHQSIFFRRSVFDRTGLYNTKYRILADWEHNFRWFLSSAIRYQYVDEIVAHYADGGLSESTVDRLFYNHRSALYAIHGRSTLRTRRRLSIAKDEAKRAIVSGDWSLLQLSIRALLPI